MAHSLPAAPAATAAAASTFTIELRHVTLRLSDGRTLFDNLTHTFGTRRTGLVGRNGVGKSMLARMLAGLLAPDSGRVAAHGTVRYLPRRNAVAPGVTVAGIAGLGPLFAASARLARGDGTPEDLTLLDGRWHLAGDFAAALACAAWRRDGARLLLLDEPGNHLDLPALQALQDALNAWPGALAIVSHDRHLLDALHLTHVLAWDPAGWVLAQCSRSG